MNKNIRLATGNKVKVIKRNSPYFGKIGELVEIRNKSVEMINRGSKVISSGTECCFVVKLEDTGNTEVFTLEQLEKID
jgi:hypothetical protein